MTSFVDYVGLAWESGAKGPESYDCWSFFRMVQKEHFSRIVPEITVDANDIRVVMKQFQGNAEFGNWEEVSNWGDVSEGDAVLMSQSKFPSHVGVYIGADGGGVLHCVQGAGVVFSSPASLSRNGWSNIRLYKYRKNE